MKNSKEAIQLRALLEENPTILDGMKVTPRVEESMRLLVVQFHEYLGQIGDCLDFNSTETLGLLMRVCPSIADLLERTREPDNTTDSRMTCAFMKAAVATLMISCVEKDHGGVN